MLKLTYIFIFTLRFGASKGFMKAFSPLTANPTKWSNTLKQFAGKLR